MSEIPKFIKKKNKDGDDCLILNPEYEKYRVRQRYSIYLKKSGIPPFYYDIEFDDYFGEKNSEAYKTIISYANNLDSETTNFSHLYLYGNNNTQKTALACNILKTGMRKGLKAKFVSAGVLISKLMKVQGYSTDYEADKFITDLKNSKVLCIDDIFDSNKTLFWKREESKHLIIAEWDTFLREIVSSNTKLILTSNFYIDNIKNDYSGSLFELIDRNFITLELTENVKRQRKSDLIKAISNDTISENECT